MKYIEVEIPENVGYLIPIGDLHIGDKAFGKEGKSKLLGYLNWVKERPNARVFLNGDIFNCASRFSVTSPFDTNSNEYIDAIELFKPYKDQIIGAVTGNHEHRLEDSFGINPVQLFCLALGIPYCGYSAMLRFKIGKRKDSNNRWTQNYFVYCHHTTGGGGTIGGKLNRVTKLRDIVEGADVLIGSHNHQLAVAPVDVFAPSMQANGVVKRRIWFVDAGSYLDWEGSYAEKGMMSPSKLGSPRIRFSGQQDHHDVHISL